MIVIPERRRFLIVRIGVSYRLTLHIPILRIAIVFRPRLRSVDMNHGPHPRLIFFSSVQIVIDRKEMLLRKAIHPFDRDALSRSGFSITGPGELPL